LPLGKPITLDKLLTMDHSDAPSIEEIQARYLHDVEEVEAELGHPNRLAQVMLESYSYR
jgi:hypothetical protein